VGVVALVVGAVAATELGRAGTDIAALAHAQETVIAPLQAIRAGQNDQRELVLRAALADGAAEAALAGQITSDDSRINADVAAVDGQMRTIAGEAWSAVKTQWAAYTKLRDSSLLPLAAANQDARFRSVYESQAVPIANALNTAMDAAVSSGVAFFKSTAAASQHKNNTAIVQLWVVLAIGLALALGLSLYIARAIRGPLARVKRALEAMADRDLTVAAEVHSSDEVGQMAQALRTARENFRSVISNVVNSAQAVASSSEELSASTVQVSAAAEETAAQAGVVAAASEQVSYNVQTVAAGSEEMDASIREIAQNASEAARVASSAMARAEATSTTVGQLGVSSQQIGNVVKAITSIAAQTNLLALNATIEAARAGEAGKGFAVVANEVKDLAQETTRATEDIVARVEAIQSDSGRVVEAISEITTIVASINDYQTSIASAVEQQTATTSEMSRNVNDAASGTGEIASNISGVATAAASTTEAVAQSRAAIDDLARMSADLHQQVASFVV
jgi:methyl-accepting chemotaxis protein